MSLFFMHSQSAIHEAVASIHGDSQFMTRRVNSSIVGAAIGRPYICLMNNE